jgi:hypothetical protein
MVLVVLDAEPDTIRSAGGGIASIEKCNYLIVNRTRNIPACSIFSQTTTLLRSL